MKNIETTQRLVEIHAKISRLDEAMELVVSEGQPVEPSLIEDWRWSVEWARTQLTDIIHERTSPRSLCPTHLRRVK